MAYLGVVMHNDQECYCFMNGAVKIHIVKESVDCLGTAACSAKSYFFGE